MCVNIQLMLSFFKNFLGIFLTFSLSFSYYTLDPLFLRTFFQINYLLFQSFQKKFFLFYIFCLYNQIKKKLLKNQNNFSLKKKNFNNPKIFILGQLDILTPFRKKEKLFNLNCLNFSFRGLNFLFKDLEQKRKSREEEFFIFQRNWSFLEKNFGWFLSLGKFNKKQICNGCRNSIQINVIKFIKKKNLYAENFFFLEENPGRLIEFYKTKKYNFSIKKKIPTFLEQMILFITKLFKNFENKRRSVLYQTILKKTFEGCTHLVSKKIPSKFFLVRTEGNFITEFSVSPLKTISKRKEILNINSLLLFLHENFLLDFNQTKQHQLKWGKIISLLSLLIYKIEIFKINKININK